MSPEIVIIIPALNEEQSIGWVLKRIHKVFEKYSKSYHIVVVDGGSTDKTVEIARSMNAEVIFSKR